jgi:predicted outer membrane repeat protein
MVGGSISNNIAKNHGGAIYADNSGNAIQFQDVTVDNNRALLRNGGAFYNAGANFQAIDSTFAGNQSRNGAGFFIESGSAVLHGSIISENEARQFGGGIYNRDYIRMFDTVLENNSAEMFENIFDETV